MQKFMLKQKATTWMLAATMTALPLAGCGGGSGGGGNVDELQATFNQAKEDLELGLYRAARNRVEPLIDESTEEYATLVDKNPQLLDQARMTYVMSGTLFQIQQWVGTIGQLIQVGDLLGAFAPGGDGSFQPQGGSGPLASLIDGFTPSFINFFRQNREVLEAIQGNEDFSITFRDLPVLLEVPLIGSGEQEIVNIEGEYDLGEVFMLSSVFTFAESLFVSVNSIDWTVNITDDVFLDYLLEDWLPRINDGGEIVEPVVNLIGVFLDRNARFLTIADPDDAEESLDLLGDAFAEISRALSAMEAETDDQTDDLLGFETNNDGEIILTLRTTPGNFTIPGLDTSGLSEIEIILNDAVLTSIENIEDAFRGEPGVFIEWSRDIVPLLSVAAAAILDTGVFNSFLLAAAGDDSDLGDTLENLLGSDLLDANLIGGVIEGIVPDVFAFNINAIRENLVGPRALLPFWTPTPDAQNPTTEELRAVTLMIDFECNDSARADGDGVHSNFPRSGNEAALLCTGDDRETVDLDHFTRANFFERKFAAFATDDTAQAVTNEVDAWIQAFDFVHDANANNIRDDQLEGGFGIRKDGFTSRLPYVALQDPSIGGLFLIRPRLRQFRPRDQPHPQRNAGRRPERHLGLLLAMGAETVGYGASFFAGILSFLSPCVLPLVPGYVSYLAGMTLEDIESGVDRSRLLKDVFGNAVVFVLGFSIVFILMGAGATAIGDWLRVNAPVLLKIGGVVVILLGLHLAHLLPIRWLLREVRIQRSIKPTGYLASGVIGVTFAVGWTPCIGPILASILLVASTQETVGQGVALLSVYSMGLGIPFLLAGLSIGVFFGMYRRVRKYIPVFERISGVLLIAIGILMVTDQMGWLAGQLTFFERFAR